jgi:hypothetical protein
MRPVTRGCGNDGCVDGRRQASVDGTRPPTPPLKSCGPGARRKIPTFPQAHSRSLQIRFGCVVPLTAKTARRDPGWERAARMLHAGSARRCCADRVRIHALSHTAFCAAPCCGTTQLVPGQARFLRQSARRSDRQPQRCVKKVCNNATNLLDAVLRMATGIGARRAGTGLL